MDINFHYFAIKMIAYHAGFTEEQAQKIAEYSQFIDDYQASSTFYSATIPPQTAIDAGIVKEVLVKDNPPKYEVTPVQTGFNTDITGDLLSLWTVDFMRKVIVPFHFIPPTINAGKEYKTTPAFFKDDCVISQLLNEVVEEFALNGMQMNDDILVKIGCLSHIFADTYAHANFSGYHVNQNNYEIAQCYRLVKEPNVWITNNFQDVTKEEKKAFAILPSIGHTTVGHVVDYTNSQFTLSHRNDKEKYPNISRNNSSAFLVALQELYNYFCMFTFCTNPFQDIIPKLFIGFNTNFQNVNDLVKTWNEAIYSTPNGDGTFVQGQNDNRYCFHYDTSTIYNRLIGASPVAYKTWDCSEEFWSFSLFANKIRNSI